MAEHLVKSHWYIETRKLDSDPCFDGYKVLELGFIKLYKHWSPIVSTCRGTQGSQEDTQRNGQSREGDPWASPWAALGKQEIEENVLHRNHCLLKRNPFLLSLEALKFSKYSLGFRNSGLETYFGLHFTGYILWMVFIFVGTLFKLATTINTTF